MVNKNGVSILTVVVISVVVAVVACLVVLGATGNLTGNVIKQNNNAYGAYKVYTTGEVFSKNETYSIVDDYVKRILSSAQTVIVNAQAVWPTNYANSLATCPATKVVIAGGCSASNHGDLTAGISSSAKYNNGWSCQTQVSRTKISVSNVTLGFTSTAIAYCI